MAKWSVTLTNSAGSGRIQVEADTEEAAIAAAKAKAPNTTDEEYTVESVEQEPADE